MTVKRIFHVNINCTDLERSLAFYEQLGFSNWPQTEDTTSGKNLSEAMNIPGINLKGRMFQLGDESGTCLLDLLEWVSPSSDERPVERLDKPGIARVCLESTDIWQDYETLKANGVKFYSEPKHVYDDNTGPQVVFFEDPDGTVLELAQF